MRTLVLVLAAVVLSSCNGAGAAAGSGGTATSPVRGIVHSSGEGDAQVVYVPFPGAAPVPLSARFAWSHDVTATIQPYPPYVILDGEAGSIIEPMPNEGTSAQAEIDKGNVLIRRAGVVGGMNAPGSIAAARAPGAAPPPAPNPEPLPEVDGLGSPPTGR